MPEGIVLHVEKRALGGPAELVAKVGGVAVAPVGPWVVERQAGGEERTVVVSELEAVLSLDASEFGIR
jgi:hypothetical protein